jgi:hypothetical protein
VLHDTYARLVGGNKRINLAKTSEAAVVAIFDTINTAIAAGAAPNPTQLLRNPMSNSRVVTTSTNRQQQAAATGVTSATKRVAAMDLNEAAPAC